MLALFWGFWFRDCFQMATLNPFDLLGDDDAEDPSQLIAAKVAAVATAPLSKKGPAQTKPLPSGAQQNKPASLPSKPLPPAQAGKIIHF